MIRFTILQYTGFGVECLQTSGESKYEPHKGSQSLWSCQIDQFQFQERLKIGVKDSTISLNSYAKQPCTVRHFDCQE